VANIFLKPVIKAFGRTPCPPGPPPFWFRFLYPPAPPHSWTPSQRWFPPKSRYGRTLRFLLPRNALRQVSPQLGNTPSPQPETPHYDKSRHLPPPLLPLEWTPPNSTAFSGLLRLFIFAPLCKQPSLPLFPANVSSDDRTAFSVLLPTASPA